MKSERKDIAIIGIGCRFPDATNYEEYWENLENGRFSVQEVPGDRWNYKDFTNLPEGYKGKSVSKWGGFINDVNTFDTRFFGLSNREVDAMDPQQRIMLELAWSCFEDAGIPPSSVSGENIGVYIGAFNHDFKELIERSHEDIVPHHSTGTASTVIPNRISYYFNLKGPSLEIDNACSGSLTALHTACQSIINEDCTMALAGGINILLSPTRQISFSQMGMLSPTGKCKSFDKDADGYVRGEGAGIVLLKPLHKAIADGDTIHGIIKGSAINHGGRMRTLTYPNSDAQASVITEAIKKSGVAPNTITYIEAHGTGTPKGDPMEFEGLQKAYDELSIINTNSKSNYCGIGTVKTNIGHLEAAAGIAGVIKVLMAMKYKKLPKILHYHHLNPKISLDGSPFYMIDEVTEWHPKDEDGIDIPRRAGVSSFGFGGTNGHIILEEPPKIQETRNISHSYYFLALSAKNDESLKQKVINLSNWIEKNREVARIEDISSTLLLGREHFQKRIAIISNNLIDLQEKLVAILDNKKSDDWNKGEVFKNENFSKRVIEEYRTVIGAIKKMKEFHTLAYKKQLINLADFYVRGFSIEWEQILKTKRRINLPTYPFVKEKCWMPKVNFSVNGDKGITYPIPTSQTGALHPFVHENTSDFTGQRFSSLFTGTEDFLHSTNENKSYLPESAHLEMIRVAAQRSMAVQKDSTIVIKDVEWIEPVVIDHHTIVHMGLYPVAEGELEWEIYTEVKGTEEEPEVRSEGKVSVIKTERVVPSLPKIYDERYPIQDFEKKTPSIDNYIKEIWTDNTKERNLLVRFKEIKEKENQGYKERELIDIDLLEACLELVNVYLTNKRGFNTLFSMGKLEIPVQASQPLWGVINIKNSEQDSLLELDIVLYDQAENVVAAITGLRYQNQNIEEVVPPIKSKMEPKEQHELMTFEEKWEESALTLEEKQLHSVVVLVTDENRRQVIERKLKQLNPEITINFIGFGESYQKESTNRYTVHYGDKSGYVACLKDIMTSVGKVDAVLYLWPTEEEKWITDPTGILYLLQGIAEAKVKPDRVLLAGGYQDDLERSHLESWIGIERSTGLVMPGTKVSIIIANRNETHSADWVERLWKEIHVVKAESVWYEGNHRMVNSIRPIQVEESSQTVPLKKGGVYLLTGGVGGLGMIFSRWLVEKYQAKLILINRSSEEAKKDKLQELKNLGAEVVYYSADVCNADELKQAVKAGKEHFGRLDGVIHAAGIEGKGSILEKSVEEYLRCLGPKVQGTLALEEALQGETLDFICYFSSSSAIIGDFGNGDYAVGNRFLMSYGAYREQEGYPGKTVIINWPLWKSEGMGFEDEEGSKMYLKSSGQKFLESEEGTAIFEKLLSQTRNQHLVMVGSRERVYRFLRIKEKVDAKMEKIETNKVIVSPGKGRRPEMKDWTIEQCLLWDLKDNTSQILQIPKEKLGIEENLADFGFDSVSLGEFAELLSNRYQIDITPDIFFGYPTMERLSEYLLERYRVEMAEFYHEGEEHPIEVEQEVSYALAGVAATKEKYVDKKERKITRRNFSNQKSRDVSKEDSIAIIGMSGRFPEARSVDEFWSILKEGKEVIREVPHERTEWPEADRKGRKFGILPGLAEFDPLFFEISPREASYIDPRQRLLLQETWKALEDAGYGSKAFDNEKIGMFVGIEDGDYKTIAGNEAGITTNHNAILAARLSYFLNLDGPNMAINTACSSSLVAVHQACQSLRSGECDTAIVAGANLMITPELYNSMNHAGMLSEEGTCYAFDKRANGMVPGEAVAAIVLKRQSKAEADRNPIYASIVGSGINYDGKTNGITAPSGSSQSKLIKEVYDHYHINPQDMEYIVTHGTGTKLGDPVEINALSEAFKDYSEARNYCALTSVKPNIGHTLAASGLVSLISLVMSLKHEMIPASINCEQPNNYIQWENSPFYVNRANREWKDRDGKRRLSAVSSFGMSGTNAHVVLQSYVPEESENILPSSLKEKPYYLLALSAKTPESLQQRIRDLKVMLEREQDFRPLELANISYTLMEGRQHFQYRFAVVVSNTNDALHVLQHSANGGDMPNLFKGTVTKDFTIRSAISRTIDELIAECVDIEGNSKAYKENLYALAEYYCMGYEISCENLLRNIKLTKVHLPTYSFARENHWVENTAIAQTTKQSNIKILHPLLHQNVSTLARQRYLTNLEENLDSIKTFTNSQYFQKSKGVHLEMARMAIHDAGKDLAIQTAGITLHDVEWFETIGDEKQGKVYTEIFLEDDETIVYKIYSEHEETVFCQGKGSFLQTTLDNQLDIRNIQGNCNQAIVESKEFNTILKALEIDHRESIGIEKLYTGKDAVLAKVALQSEESDNENILSLHPNLIESALLAVTGLSFKRDKTKGVMTARKPVGIALENLEIMDSYDRNMWVYIQLREDDHKSILDSTQKVDIVLCNDEGKIYVKINNYTFKLSEKEYTLPISNDNELDIASMVPNASFVKYNAERNKGSEENTVMIPKWKKISIDSKEEFSCHGNMLIVGGSGEIRMEFLRACPSGKVWDIQHDNLSIDELATSLQGYGNIDHIVWIAPVFEENTIHYNKVLNEQEVGVIFLFKLFKSLHQLGYSEGELEFTFITCKTQHVFDREVINPTHSGVHGLIGSVAKEYPNWNIRLIDMGTTTNWPITRMLSIPTDDEGNTVALRDHEWYKLELVTHHDTPPLLKETTYRQGGVYVVIGGAGGIGEVWSEYMIRNFQANIIWIGRSKRNKDIDEKITRLSLLGPAPYYLSADATNLESLENAYNEIKRIYPHVHGVVHSAVGMLDKSIAEMDVNMYKTIIGVKIDASVHMAKVFENEPLDLMLYFSSVTAFSKLGGQSGYSTGCTFKDGFARRLSKDLTCNVKTINWGYWGNVGIGESLTEAYKIRLSMSGMNPIEPMKAMEDLDLILRYPECQILYMRRDTSKVNMLVEGEKVASSDGLVQSTESKKEESSVKIDYLLREKVPHSLKSW